MSTASPLESDESLDAFVAAFEARALGTQDWTHAAHVTVGGCYCLAYGEDGALERMRAGIRLLNESLGGRNTPTSGYHESLTRFWLKLIARFLEEHRALHPQAARIDAIRALLGSLGHRSQLYREYWTYDALASTAARAAWVEPDALPLDVAVLACDSPLGWRSARELLMCYAAGLPARAILGSLEAELEDPAAGYTDPHSSLLLARAAGASIGCIALHRMEPGVGEIKRLYVAPEQRRRGTARVLLNAAIARARQAGTERVRLGTLHELAAAQALYRRLGFEPVASYPGADPVDDLLFELRLA